MHDPTIVFPPTDQIDMTCDRLTVAVDHLKVQSLSFVKESANCFRLPTPYIAVQLKDRPDLS